MKIKAAATFVYGVFLVIGGVMGHIKADSLVSLIMGLLFGVLAMTSAIGMYKQTVLGYFSGIGLTAFLLLFFCFRLWKTGAFMPAGVVIILSVLVLGVLLRNTHNEKVETI